MINGVNRYLGRRFMVQYLRDDAHITCGTGVHISPFNTQIFCMITITYSRKSAGNVQIDIKPLKI